MPLADSSQLRNLISRLYPGIVLTDTPSPSGQRVVYFCHFDDTHNFLGYPGELVLKVSEGVSAQGIAYIQKEIDILQNLKLPGYPTLLHDDVIAEDPDTEERFKYRLFFTFEERIDAQPLNEVNDYFQDEASVIELLYKLISVLKPLWQSTPPLIHRDLKPQNILINNNKEVIVIDLGIAREEGAAGVTVTGAPFGPCTPYYASPEQAINDKRNITFKSDIFSLGIICYELLSKSNPFLCESNLTDEILDKIINYKPPTLYELELSSKEFSEIIEKMMERQPYKRFRRIDILEEKINNLRSLQ